MNNVYEALSSIGIRVGSSILNQKTIEFVDIERTIVEGLYKSYEDSKIPSLIITWAKIHHEYIIVEKFGKLIKEFESIMGPCIWINIFNLFCYYEFKNSKFKKLISKEKDPYFHLNKEIALTGIKLKGEFSFLSLNNIYISKSFFRIREADVLSCKELISTSHQYKNRYIYGACWRADIIYSIEIGISNPSQISKFIGCSYEPAHRIFKEYNLAIAS